MKLSATTKEGDTENGSPPIAQSTPQSSRRTEHRCIVDADGPSAPDNKVPTRPGGEGFHLSGPSSGKPEVNVQPLLDQSETDYQHVGVQAGNFAFTNLEVHLDVAASIYHPAAHSMLNSLTFTPPTSGALDVAHAGVLPGLLDSPVAHGPSNVHTLAQAPTMVATPLPCNSPSSDHQTSRPPIQSPDTMPPTLSAEQAHETNRARSFSPAQTVPLSDLPDLSSFPSSQPRSGYYSDDDEPLENEDNAPQAQELPQNAEDEAEAQLSEDTVEPPEETQFAGSHSEESDISMSSA
ncbi:hypothetical protein FRC01_010303 [Tulasnella sp. 417]|nr:hypothetical protein FRC01_010303 [Tulasnella sp. 417]